MAVITAAAIGAVGAVGAAGLSYAASQQGGGGGGNPSFRQGPSDPLDRSMRSYYARATLANATKTMPSFGAFATSGGDPSLAKFDLDMPDMKPSEAAAFGFTGVRGETIPGQDYESLASGDVKNLNPEQILYLAKERRRQAVATGQPVGGWAHKVLSTDRQLRSIQARKDALEQLDPSRLTPHQEHKIEKLGRREERFQARQTRQLHPDQG
jgi:hypothetical protein